VIAAGVSVGGEALSPQHLRLERSAGELWWRPAVIPGVVEGWEGGDAPRCPEVVLRALGMASVAPSQFAADVWAVGVLTLHLALGHIAVDAVEEEQLPAPQSPGMVYLAKVCLCAPLALRTCACAYVCAYPSPFFARTFARVCECAVCACACAVSTHHA
jgi:hypothetical protein